MHISEDIWQYKLSFHGKHLDVLYTHTPTSSVPQDIYVSMPSLCSVLTLNLSGQIQKLNRNEHMRDILCILPIITAGGTQNIRCMPLRWTAYWLETMAYAKLSKATQESIHQYRKQILEPVLADLQTNSPHVVLEKWGERVLFQSEGSPRRSRSPIALPLPEMTLPKDPLLDAQFSDDETQKRRIITVLRKMPPFDFSSQTHVTTGNSEIDYLIREATFSQSKWNGVTFESSSHTQFQLSLGSRQNPLRVEEANKHIGHLRASALLTARVLQGLWFIRRQDPDLVLPNGLVAVLLEEVLEWRGVARHRRNPYSGSAIQRDGGFRTEDKEKILADLELLGTCIVKGERWAEYKGQMRKHSINGPYVHYETYTVETPQGEKVLCLFMAPGSWMLAFDTPEFRAEINRKLFQLNPQNEQHELRLGLFLVERWRQLANAQEYGNPISMAELLEASFIEVLRRNPSRFIQRIEDAIGKLWEYGILGTQPQKVIGQHTSQNQNELDAWLATQWILMPPHSLIQEYSEWKALSQPASSQGDV